MMDTDEIIRIAKNKGLKNKEYIEKDYYLDLILYELSLLSKNLVFKGGTALYKIYGFPRFSEDLDFSTIEKIEDIEIIEKIAKKYNFQV
ncbi:MAG: nucleotidyl transferase AbiEii/AbiGii toxin family protein, partial [Candidatus Micrarchaeia archaeon]